MVAKRSGIARHHALRLLDVGHDLLARLAAGGEAERDAARQQLQRGAAVDVRERVRPLRLGFSGDIASNPSDVRCRCDTGRAASCPARAGPSAASSAVLKICRLRPQVRRRIAVAVEAPAHGERRRLPHQRHGRRPRRGRSCSRCPWRCEWSDRNRRNAGSRCTRCQWIG